MKKKNIVQKRTYRSTFTNLTRTITGGMVSALALVLILSACARINEELDPSKGMIVFGASTGYTNAPQTKTEYSGVDENGTPMFTTTKPSYERIDWVSGTDLIKVLCGQAVDANEAPNTDGNIYNITGHSESGHESTATSVSLTSGSQFYWGAGDHYFYALYPAAGTKDKYQTSSQVTDATSSIAYGNSGKTTAVITGSIPATQNVVRKETGSNRFMADMNYAYMYAATKSAQTTEVVPLQFHPLVTTFEFYLKALDDVMANHDLKKLILSSSASGAKLSGGFTATINADPTAAPATIAASGTTGNSITVTFPSGTKLPTETSGDYLIATALTLGFAQTDLTLTLVFDNGTTDGVSKTIELKKSSDGSSIGVAACKKIYIRLGAPDAPVFDVYSPVIFDWQGNLTTPASADAITVTSHSSVFGDDLDWVIEGFYTEVDTYGKPVASSKLSGMPGWLTSYFGGLVDGSGDTVIPIECPQQDPVVSETLTNEAITENNKVNKSSVGSADSPWNVSNPTGGSTIVESANCYIVNGPGYYKLPLVMGNGVKNNALNPDEKTYKGYNGDKTNDWRALFQDYKGNNIQNPYLHKSSSGAGTPTFAYIIWEDIEGLIEADEYILPSDCITYDSTGDCYWLNFHVASVRTGNDIAETTNVPAANGGAAGPRQGNAVIAIEDASRTIMWNYHIWLTDYQTSQDIDISYRYLLETNAELNYPETDFDKVIGYELMGKDLGFTIYGRTVDRDYPANTIYVNFTQVGTGLTDVMQISQTAHNIHAQIDRGRPTFQYGRSFAIWPDGGLLTNGEEMVWYGKTPRFVSETGTHTQAQSIQKAGIFFARSSDDDYLTPVISTVTVSKPTTGTIGSKNFELWNANPSPVYPTNLWDADNHFTVGSFNFQVRGITMSHSPETITHKFLGFPNRSAAVLPNKTILDPNPAGYVMSSMFLSFLLRHHSWSAASDSGYSTYVTHSQGQNNGKGQYLGQEGNNYVFYTSPDKDASKKMYVPAGYAGRKNTGALSEGWVVSLATSSNVSNEIIGSIFLSTKVTDLDPDPSKNFITNVTMMSGVSRPVREDTNEHKNYWGLFPYILYNHVVELTGLNDNLQDRPTDW